ncbi:MAG: sugar phosphate isomerase/epimerase [Cyclobacteriaceae bacterium]|nr:sugar phosphate isomerase/epimerase [Cyclobacteriaceae bacterium]MDH5251116.1 sugar phosphate isomerase/epimerase [Cyclobacteriaceae bacterium]
MSLNRRKFITLSTMSGAAAMMFDRLDAFAEPAEKTKANPGFEVLIFATNWGFDGSWDQFCAKIKKLGYDGAEAWYPSGESERKEFLEAFQKHNLRIGFLVGGSDKDHQGHLQQFKAMLEGAVSLNPVYVNCHSGRDHFSFSQNKAFIDLTMAVHARTGVPIYHETHRSRILYSAPVAREFMEKVPDLRITLDISHWCNVHESLLDDQLETVALALSRTDHIHARIGHQEGPQVNDPRAPEWREAVQAHFAWWDKVVDQKRKEGKRMTILTEFGPANYLPTLPYTRQPVADQWEMNTHMLHTLRKRYA